MVRFQYSNAFEAFWQLYPRGTGKRLAFKAWLKAKIESDPEMVQMVMAALQVHKQLDQWHRDGGQYIPHAATWINQARWDDRIDPRDLKPGIQLATHLSDTPTPRQVVLDRLAKRTPEDILNGK